MHWNLTVADSIHVLWSEYSAINQLKLKEKYIINENQQIYKHYVVETSTVTGLCPVEMDLTGFGYIDEDPVSARWHTSLFVLYWIYPVEQFWYFVDIDIAKRGHLTTWFIQTK